jgi:hypothetical protein
MQEPSEIAAVRSADQRRKTILDAIRHPELSRARGAPRSSLTSGSKGATLEVTGGYRFRPHGAGFGRNWCEIPGLRYCRILRTGRGEQVGDVVSLLERMDRG